MKGTKRGILRITPEMLHACLQLPDDIRVERVFEDPPEQFASSYAFNLVLSGESLPVEEPQEGQQIPQLSAQCLTISGEHGTKREKWKFRVA